MKSKFKKPELLAPAGSLEKLKIAFQYGADAVYFGGELFSLRAAAKNFSYEDMKEGVKIAHNLGKKMYCTINVMPRNEELDKLPEFLKKLEEIGIDAVLVSDLGVFSMVKKYSNLPIHISTQANTVNYEACNMWESLGAERVVLARECSLKEIKEIRENISAELELEVFVHGSMCISYSGRCLLSSYMASRDSNRGSCAQSCRWKYSLMEQKRENEYFPIEEDSHGTYIMNSKDLCMIEYIPELMEAGITSLKIEGRNKSEYYVAIIVNAYRKAIDLYYSNPENYELPKVLFDEMYKVSHREYHTGFFFNEPKTEGIIYNTNDHVREYDVVAIVHEYDEENQIALCRQRNKFVLGDRVEILSPNSVGESFVVENLYNEDGENIESCPHPGMMCKIKIPFKVEKNSFIRKELI
ncbi:U32 family peptidase [Clostridium sp. SHJSY1]|uniref:peptidase U32 family protein n=1 Tax=Clostridium sp. SHJSY1 TaxID=2942483 RepID=UPI0028760771|nr:U32 family peptidase [Clostridium sp. SHJSY1]MDS0526418.1 U32 family peptidase [Clostridium sp. SHJSY1]